MTTRLSTSLISAVFGRTQVSPFQISKGGTPSQQLGPTVRAEQLFVEPSDPRHCSGHQLCLMRAHYTPHPEKRVGG
jgi:hypothetical protein